MLGRGCLGLGLGWAWPTGGGGSSKGSSGQRQPAQICTLREIEDDRLWGPGGAGSEETWQGEGREEQLGSQGLVAPSLWRAQRAPPPTLKSLSEF